MSDFDKRLSNMMNEEEHFPNMQKNWEKLAPHLHPPQPLKRVSLQKRWLVGIAASVSVLAVSAMSYFLMKTNQENKALKSEVSILKNKTQEIENITITHNNNISTEKSSSSGNGAENTLSTNGKKVEETTSEGGLNVNKDIKSNPTSSNKTSVNEPKVVVSNSIKTPFQQSGVISPDEKTQKETPSVVEAKKEILKKNEAKTKERRENTVQNESSNAPKNLDNHKPIVPSENQKKDLNNVVNNENEPILSGETVATTMVKKTNLTVSPLGILLKPAFSNSTAAPLSIENALMLNPAIMRSQPRSGRLAIGVQTFVSLGDDEGRDRRGPALSGFGLVASYDLTRNFEIMASADFGGMRYDFRDGGPKGNRIPKEPNFNQRPPNHTRLKRVSGNQERQQFSIGLKFKIPTNTFLTPSFNVGYDLQRLGKQSCRFDFVNDITNTEVPVTQVLAPQISNNLWHAGIGLEAKVSSFIIGVSAEYQKDFSINNDNRVILRGGVKYHF
jgi:hypothetical protein